MLAADAGITNCKAQAIGFISSDFRFLKAIVLVRSRDIEDMNHTLL